VFTYSLTELTTCDHTAKQEDEISAALLLVLQKICKDWSLRDKMEIPAPLAQLPQQSAEKAIKKGINALPKPDFSCPKFDPVCGENLFLDIECKLLGQPTSPSWNLNRNYMSNGIERFDNEHQYGRGVHDGFMIGYIISMCPDSICTEVNRHLNTTGMYLCFNFSGKVNACTTRLKRTCVKPEIFNLSHLWVDLRSIN
jgi:hypothetical protein